jgi:hypothetical protein
MPASRIAGRGRAHRDDRCGRRWRHKAVRLEWGLRFYEGRKAVYDYDREPASFRCHDPQRVGI